jgi:light-regulated signal transduction histidine kinase (bacteriophytochrome)
VDLSALASEIIANLKQENPEHQVEVNIEAEMRVQGSGTLLRQALWNLLENAWKFTAGRSQALIDVGSTERPGERVFHVRDNGVGFDMTYADKLFKPFGRLHASSEYCGLGIGLANSEKIINRHGGLIWAISGENEGATFFFTIP